MLTFRFEEEWMLSPNIAAALSSKGFIQFGNLGRRGDWVSYYSTTDVIHNMCDSTIAVDYSSQAGIGWGVVVRIAPLGHRRHKRLLLGIWFYY
jgi:hypothetical protein